DQQALAGVRAGQHHVGGHEAQFAPGSKAGGEEEGKCTEENRTASVPHHGSRSGRRGSGQSSFCLSLSLGRSGAFLSLGASLNPSSPLSGGAAFLVAGVRALSVWRGRSGIRGRSLYGLASASVAWYRSPVAVSSRKTWSPSTLMAW